MARRPEVAQTSSRLDSRDDSNDDDNDRHQTSSGNSNSDPKHGNDNGNIGGGNGSNGNGGNGSNGSGGSGNSFNGNSGGGNGPNGNGGGGGSNSNSNSFGGAGFCAFCVNDNDPRIIYNGAWVLTSNGTGGFDHTTHETTESGSTATFSFNGTGIVVFGTVSKSDDKVFPPTVNYTVDAADPVTTQQPFATNHIQNQPLFAVGQLSPEHEHTIVIDVINGSAPYEFDYFFVLPRSNFSQASFNGKHTPTSSTSSFLVGSTSGAVSGSQQDDPTKTVSMTALKATAAALGTLVVILLFTCLFLLFRLRRISRTQKNLQNFIVNPLAAGRYQHTYASSFSGSSKAGSLSGSGGWSRSMSPVLSNFPRTITDTGTIFTTTESILRNYPSTNYTSSAGERSTTYSHGTGLGSLGPASLYSQSQSRHSQGLPVPVTAVPLPIAPAPKVLAQSSPALMSLDKTRRDSADSSHSAPPGIGSPKNPLSMS